MRNSLINDCSTKQHESWTRYGRALSRASANVVHEVNAPLGVALARVQLALRLLDEFPVEQVAAVDEQLRGCEAAIRTSASVIRDLNNLRQDLEAASDATSATHVVTAAYRLALPDATLAGCEIELGVPLEPMAVACESHELLVLLLELVWDRVMQGAKRICIQLNRVDERKESAVQIVVASDLKSPCTISNQEWIDLLVASCNGSIQGQLDGRGCQSSVIELLSNNAKLTCPNRAE